MAAGGVDFLFAYNNPNFSDKVLRVKVSAPIEDGALSKNQEKKGDDFSMDICPSLSPDCGNGSETVEIFASSVLLAGHSSFFRALFVDGNFCDSSSKTVDIHVKPEEKQSFMLLLQYIHSNKFPNLESSEAVMSLWLVAQQFGVPSCSEKCLIRLRDFPMSLPSSSYFLEKASVVEQTDAFRHLRDDSARFLVRHFERWEINLLHIPSPDENLVDELMSLTPASMEALIGHPQLQAADEANIAFTVLAWVRQNFHAEADRLEAMERIAPHIRFPTLQTEHLHSIASQKEMQGDVGRQLIMEALWFKACAAANQPRLIADAKSNIRYQRRHSPEVTRYGQVNSMEVWRHIKIVTEMDMATQIGHEITFDLVDDDRARSIYVLGRSTITKVKEEIAKELGLCADKIRLWMFVKRQNGTWRPQRRFTGAEEEQRIGRISVSFFQFFVEQASHVLSKEPRVQQQSLREIAADEIILYFKLYSPKESTISYVGHMFMKKDSRFRDVRLQLLEMAGLPLNEPIRLFEEIKFNPAIMCEEVLMETPLVDAQLENGDIICIQRELSVAETMKYSGRHAHVKAYFEFMNRRSKMTLDGLGR